MTEQITLEGTFEESMAGQRLDAVLAKCYPDYSRAMWAKWIESGSVLIEGKPANKKYKVKTGEHYAVAITLEAANDWVGQDIPVDTIYADEHIIVINKPVGLVVHPGAGTPDRTLVNALLYHYPECEHLPRAGVVHRLDKDTSGIMVVARSLKAHTVLVDAISNRDVKREYEAIVQGYLVAGGDVDAPIARDPKHRTKMAVVQSGKPALTHYRVLERFTAHSYIACQLETGRTHQIRVHMKHIGYPLVGDQVYNKRMVFPKKAKESLKDCIINFKRQALHARRLSFIHPVTSEPVSFEAPVPDDMTTLLEALRDNEHRDY